MTAVLAIAAIALCGAAVTSPFLGRGALRAVMALLLGIGIWSGAYATALFVFGAAYGFFLAVERLMGNRVSAEIEHAGLDALEMGTDAYPRG